MPRREGRRSGCTSCKKRHLKCDNSEPTCSRCAASGKKCIRPVNVRFRYSSDLTAHASQTWVKSGNRLHFVDETDELETLYSAENEGRTPTNNSQERPLFTDGEIEQPTQFSLASTLNAVTPTNLESASQERALSAIPPGSKLGLASPPRSSHLITFPLRQPNEVRLIKYYLEYMCKWFDLCDTKHNHFASEVPQRAITCPTLMNAIFALSSRHLSTSGQFDQYAADRYHQECLRYLTTISTDASALMNDDLLAATILLRTLEELDVPILGTDHQGHLLGIQVFMNTQDSSSVASGLRQASFWVGLRQEIYMAFVNQRPVKTKLDHSFIDRSFTEADDDTWANRIILNCAEIVRYCFGEPEHPISDYHRLKNYDEQWLRSRPLSFLPFSYREADRALGEVFPEICYLNHAVVIGIVHSIFARVLLMCYNPTIPRIGPSQKRATQQMEEEIKSQIMELCGTALSNRRTIPAMFTACMGVTMCGDRFTEKFEQQALLSILVKTEVDHGWPTATAQAHLKRAWGWEKDT